HARPPSAEGMETKGYEHEAPPVGLPEEEQAAPRDVETRVAEASGAEASAAPPPDANAWDTVRALVPLLRPYPWAVPVLLTLGSLASLFEGVGISLFIPLLEGLDRSLG